MTTSQGSRAWALRLASTFERRFPRRDPSRRQLGREGEYPVVHADGSAADIAVLWPRLQASGAFQVLAEGDLVVGLEGPEVTYSAEVGKGTIEIIVGPCPDLFGLQARYEAAMEPLLRACEAEGLLVLGYGIQPLTPPSVPLMTGKQRYGVLLEQLGDLWLSFAVTASDQVHVDVAVDELVAATNLGNLMAPVVVALLANSPVQAGAWTGSCSTREATMNAIQAEGHRHGMPAGPSADLAAWIERTLDMTYLMHREGTISLPYGKPFQRWLDEAVRDESDAFQAWLWHEHYVWNSARPRSAHGTVELRAACQQPWSEHMANAALGAGLITAHRRLWDHVHDVLGPDAWSVMARWHRQVVAEGLAAAEPVDGLLAGILDLAAEGLEDRGRGEHVLLDPLRARLTARRNPAQVARDVFEAGGMAALLDHARVR